jgi:hypothetical protein
MKDLANTDDILILEVNHPCPENKSSQLLEETIEIKFKISWTQQREFQL